MPVKSLEAITDPKILLKKYWGHNQFRPLQEKIINNVLSKKDSLVIMPTGGGKSLCYQLPSLVFGGVTLVISPLIALMKDQVDALKAKGISATFINSTLSVDEIDEIKGDLLGGKTKLLYIAAERYSSLVFQIFLAKLKIDLIAVDEAHIISEWGHEFRPDYRKLESLRHNFPQTPIVALTATATVLVRSDIIQQLHLNDPGIYTSGFNRPNLTYKVEPKRKSIEKLLKLLRKHRTAIVYCFSRNDTEDMAARLQAQGLKARPYHAGIDDDAKDKTQEMFLRGEINVVVATIAFGMGIDKPDIRLVAHMDFPKSIEGYYQETGRAGRDGNPSECILFYSYGDKKKQDYFIDKTEDIKEKARAKRRLSDIINYCHTKLCRRVFLLNYFGEEYKKESCGNCDNCVDKTIEYFDATIITQKILSAVHRTRQRFGVTHIVDILVGQSNNNVTKYDHDKLSVFGIAKKHSDIELKSIIRDLIIKNLIYVSGDVYPTLSLTKKGADFLRQNKTITLPKNSRKAIARNKSKPYSRNYRRPYKQTKSEYYSTFDDKPKLIKRNRSKANRDEYWWE